MSRSHTQTGAITSMEMGASTHSGEVPWPVDWRHGGGTVQNFAAAAWQVPTGATNSIHQVGVLMGLPGLVEVAVAVGMLCAAVGFSLGLAIGCGRQPRWAERGSFVHKVSIGFATLDRLDAVMLRFEVEEGSRLAGVEVAELRLPSGSGVALITRGPDVFLPSGSTVLRTGDQVLAVTARAQVGEVEDRLRSVSRFGRLAGWYETLETNSAQALGVRRGTV